MKIDSALRDAQTQLRTAIHAAESFDILTREIEICGRAATLFFIDGFVKDEIMEKLMEFFYSIGTPDTLHDAQSFARGGIPYVEVALEDELSAITTQFFSGVSVLLVDGFDRAILIDTRTYPQRETGEPDKDKVFRGSKDGFVETLIFNTALIRRRIRDSALRMEYYQIGTTSKTDVALCYLSSRADSALLEKIRAKLSAIRVDALTMNQESLAEALIRHRWYNPFPKFKYTERPDTTAAQILEGDIVLLVDNSPSAMILPVTLFDVIEEANDFYFPPITGTYLRLTRCLVTF